jgi:ketol-acid reductoisomerase
MAARIYTDSKISSRRLQGKMCAVIGFGSQGRAQALNLSDSKIKVVAGLYPGSKSRRSAKRAGFRVLSNAEAVGLADVIFLALPDTSIPDVFERDVAPNLRPGQTLVFAHGFAVYYRTIVPRRDVDVIMVAPKGLGPMVRREFVAGRGVPALVAVHQDATGHAKETALAWAKAIGSGRAGIIETTFRAETETDLFGEQAVLCGGVTALIRGGFETLVQAGYAPELAYF